MKAKTNISIISVPLAVLICAITFWFLLSGSNASPVDDLSLKASIKPDQKTVSYKLISNKLQNPWGMTFLPSGEILITEKTGKIRIVKDDKLLDEEIQGVPEIYLHGQGGLLDIEIHPKFSENSWLYLSYSSGTSEKGGNTAIARAKLQSYRLENLEVIYRGEPDTDAAQHFGSRIAFDDKGYLFFSIGDRYERELNPQSLKRDGGKIYRIHDDGRIPKDNPFVDKAGAKTAIYSYGHRNPQGLAKHPISGEIWSHEHGPKGGDELNLIKPGLNYGWPVISYGINYSGSKFTDISKKEGMEQPKSYWTPSIAPCGMTILSGEKYPGWKGDILLGSLKFGYLLRVNLEGDRVVSQEQVAAGIGRVRNVEESPDGFVYVGVEGRGLFKLLPP